MRRAQRCDPPEPPCDELPSTSRDEPSNHMPVQLHTCSFSVTTAAHGESPLVSRACLYAAAGCPVNGLASPGAPEAAAS
eukprot:scaffold12670_cov119-Isochrysis_galbana.AAC.3